MRGVVGNTRDITERVEAEQALHSSVESFRVLVAEAPVGIVFTDAETRVTFVNDRWLEITGLSRDEVCGESCWERITHPEDLEAVAAHVFESLARDGRADFESRVVRPDGTVVSVRGHAIEVRGADGRPTSYVSSMEDVTAEREARDRAAQWGVLLHHSHDLVSMYDAEDRSCTSSPSHERVLGFTPDELVGTSPIDLLHPDEREDVAKAFEEQITGDGHRDARSSTACLQGRVVAVPRGGRRRSHARPRRRWHPRQRARRHRPPSRPSWSRRDQAHILERVARACRSARRSTRSIDDDGALDAGRASARSRRSTSDGAFRVIAAPNLDRPSAWTRSRAYRSVRRSASVPGRFHVVALGTDLRSSRPRRSS